MVSPMGEGEGKGRKEPVFYQLAPHPNLLPQGEGDKKTELSITHAKP